MSERDILNLEMNEKKQQEKKSLITWHDFYKRASIKK